MRVRNKKDKDIILKNCSIYLENPEKCHGNWQKEFNNDHPIHVEIGCGKCQFIVEKAKQHPNINFIGVERVDSVLALGIENHPEHLDNLRFIHFDATKITELFDKEISCLYLNFSDPWPKKRHEKRRLTHAKFLEKYEFIFKDHPEIIQKTDNRQLFEFSLVSYNEKGYRIKEISLDLQNSAINDNIKTEYEEKFIAKGCKIYYVKVEKN